MERVFKTGAQRDTAEGKGRYDLIPFEAIDALAKRYEYGAKLHGGPDGENWKKGIPDSSFYDSALRHLFKARAGLDDEDHLAAAMWNICGLIWNRDHKKGNK